MAEGTYEHACMRAELLGLEKPDEEEFLRMYPQSQQNTEEHVAAQFEVCYYKSINKFNYVFLKYLIFSGYILTK